MKKIFAAFIIAVAFTGQSFALRATPTPDPASNAASPSTTPSVLSVSTAAASASAVLDKSLEMLKARIATSVAKIDKATTKINIGYIIAKDKTSLGLKTKENKDFKIVLDATVTKSYQITGNTKKEIKSDDLVVGDYIIVSGPPLESSITANNIYRDDEYLVLSGKISELDSAKFTIKVMTTDKDEYLLSVQSSTKQQMIDINTAAIYASGFSKLKVGDTIHFTAKKPADKKLEVTPTRILTIPQEYFMK